MTSYNYDINNFENGYDPVQLYNEIKANNTLNSTTIVSIDGDFDNNTLTIRFSTTLSDQQKGALDTVLSNHVPNGTTSTIEYSEDLDLKGHRIKNLGSPIEGLDAANKQYVDQAVTDINGGVDLSNLSIGNDQIKADAGIDATKIADGSVTNTEFGYLSDLTANVQSQITSHNTNQNNPHHVTKQQVGLGNVSNTKCNFNATTIPSNLDDSVSGYSVGSIWINKITQKGYVCVDSMELNAKWAETTSLGEIIQGQNLGSGEGIYQNKVDSTLKFKGLSGSTNVGLDSNSESITIKSRDSHSFLLSPIMIEAMDDEYCDVLCFPWLQSEFGGYKNGKLIFEAEINSSNPLGIRLRNVTHNATLAELNPISESNFYELIIANPSQNARLKLQVKNSNTSGNNPRIFGVVLKYET